VKTSIKNLILAVALMLAFSSNLTGSESKYYLGKSKEYLLGSGDFSQEYEDMIVKVKSELVGKKKTYHWKELEEVEYPKEVYYNYPMPINSKYKNFYNLIIIIDNDGENDDGKFDESDTKRLTDKFGNDVVVTKEGVDYIKTVTWIPEWRREDYKKGPKTITWDCWVTIDGEIQNYFKKHPLPTGATDKEAAKRTGMLLGMPETNTGRYFAEILVKPDDLFRPTRSGSIKEGVIHDLSWSDYVLDQGEGKVNKKEWKELINDHLVQYDGDHEEGKPYVFAKSIEYDKFNYPFPFTGLGYTLNWTILYEKPNMKLDITDKELVGMSEFGVKKGSKVIYTGICTPTLKYIAPNLTPGIVDEHDSRSI
jgi:hypothetical protein